MHFYNFLGEQKQSSKIFVTFNINAAALGTGFYFQKITIVKAYLNAAGKLLYVQILKFEKREGISTPE